MLYFPSHEPVNGSVGPPTNLTVSVRPVVRLFLPAQPRKKFHRSSTTGIRNSSLSTSLPFLVLLLYILMPVCDSARYFMIAGRRMLFSSTFWAGAMLEKESSYDAGGLSMLSSGTLMQATYRLHCVDSRPQTPALKA